MRRVRPGAAASRGRRPPPARGRRGARPDQRRGRRPVRGDGGADLPRLWHVTLSVSGERGPAEGGPARPRTARPRPPLPADQPLRQRPRGDPLLGGGPRPARRGRRRAAPVGRAPPDRQAAAVGDRRPGGHRPRDLPPAHRRGVRPAAGDPGGRPPVLTGLASVPGLRDAEPSGRPGSSRGVERAVDGPSGALPFPHDHALAVRLHVPGHPGRLPRQGRRRRPRPAAARREGRRAARRSRTRWRSVRARSSRPTPRTSPRPARPAPARPSSTG